MGDPLNNTFTNQHALFRQLQLSGMNNPDPGSQGPPALGTSIPGGDALGNRIPNGNTAQLFQNIAQLQGQGFRPGAHPMQPAAGQANQPGLAQGNPAQYIQQQQHLQRMNMGLAQQSSLHPGLANATQGSLNSLQNNPTLLSMMGLGNPMASNLFRNGGNNAVAERIQALSRNQAMAGQNPGGPVPAPNRFASNEHTSSPLLTASHDQNIAMNPSPQPGNPGHPPNPAQVQQAVLHKLELMSVRDLEVRLTQWRTLVINLESRMREQIHASQRPGAQQDQAAFLRLKMEYDHMRFCSQRAQEILIRKQGQAQAQNTARMTPVNMGEPNRPGSRMADGVLPGQTTGAPGWQGQPGQLVPPQGPPQRSPRNANGTPFQPTSSPQPNAEQQSQRASPHFRPGSSRQTNIPRDRATFMNFIRVWLVQTGRSPDATPKIGDRAIDLYAMYMEVERLGGPEKMNNASAWLMVAAKMGYTSHDQVDPQLQQIAKILHETYSTILVPFDLFCGQRMQLLDDGLTKQRDVQLEALNRNIMRPPNPATAGGVDPALQSMGPNDNATLTPTHQRVLTTLVNQFRDWMPGVPPQAKLLRLAQMDVGQLQQQGFTSERIAMVTKFKPIILLWRHNFLRQQQAQALAGGLSVNPGLQPHQPLQTQFPNDPRPSNGGGSVPPNMMGMPGVPNQPTNVQFPPEVVHRAELAIETMMREVRQNRHPRREISDQQRMQMVQAASDAQRLAAEFESIAKLHFLLLGNQQETKRYLSQAAVLQEQQQALQAGQAIMSLEDVIKMQQSLRVAVHNTKMVFAQRRQQHELLASSNYRPDAGPSQHHQHQIQQQLIQQQAAMQLLGPQPPRPPSQPPYGSPKLDPTKAQILGQTSKPVQQPGNKVRKPAVPGQPISTPSPAAHTPTNIESAPTPSSVNEPATPKSPRGGKAKPGKRTPSQAAKKKGAQLKIDMPPLPPFDQQASNKRQREDEALAESVMPIPGPSSPKRVKTESESEETIKTEFHNDDALASMDDALLGLHDIAPGPNGDGIDSDVLAELTQMLGGSVASGSGLGQSQSADAQADNGPKVEDLFDFSFYFNDTAGDEDPLGGTGVDVVEADTPDLNTNKETPDSATDENEQLGQKSPGKGEAPAADQKSLAGNRAPTLTEDFFEAFDDGAMPEGAYFMGGGTNGFNWSGPIDTNATSWIGVAGTAA